MERFLLCSGCVLVLFVGFKFLGNKFGGNLSRLANWNSPYDLAQMLPKNNSVCCNFFFFSGKTWCFVGTAEERLWQSVHHETTTRRQGKNWKIIKLNLEMVSGEEISYWLSNFKKLNKQKDINKLNLLCISQTRSTKV